ncbi:MAG: hypothetical protein NZ840_02595 [Anaerolineales bacterium]|nr:hypothetical protein [Anaerolineales bacterium]MDW8160924.1 hypothetical protein [Anaerolineales bacterium]
MRDLRKYAQQTMTRLIVGGLLLIVILAEFLIALFYGYEAAIGGAICIAVGLLPLAITWLFLIALDRWVKSRR